MTLELDHLIVAATDLDSGEAWLRERLGVPLAPGGQHIGVGTHNRLLQLGRGVYLELIAADPTQPAPRRPRPFMLDDPAMQEQLAEGPRLVHWVVRARAGALEHALAALRYTPGPVTPMTRGALRWRITVPADGRPAAQGLLPTVIEWDVPADAHPAARLPEAGVRLASFEVRAPAAVLGQRPEVSSPVPLHWTESAVAGLAAAFDTPRGRVAIDAAAA